MPVCAQEAGNMFVYDTTEEFLVDNLDHLNGETNELSLNYSHILKCAKKFANRTDDTMTMVDGGLLTLRVGKEQIQFFDTRSADSYDKYPN